MSTPTSAWEFLPSDEDPNADSRDQPAEELAMHRLGAGAEEFANAMDGNEGAEFGQRSDADEDSNVEQGVDALLTRQHYLAPAQNEHDNQLKQAPHRQPSGHTSAELAAWAIPRLAAERDRLIEVRAALRNAGGTSSPQDLFGELSGRDQHAADSATETFDLEASRSLEMPIAEELAEVTEAAARVSAHTYGFCERCGEPIDEERLDAVPATRYCRRDEAAVERWA